MIESIVTEIMRKMEGKADINALKSTLYMVLSRYEISEQTDIVVVNKSWEKLVGNFLFRKHIEGKSDGTIKLYKYHLSRMFEYINKPVELVTSDDLFRYISYCKEVRGVSNGYLNHIRLIMSSFFTWNHEKGVISKNPSKALDGIKCEQKIRKGFSDEDLEELKQGCKNLRDLALVEFLYSTGVRVSECAALNIDDVDFSNREVIVLGKGNKERTVYLSSTACMYLKKYLNDRSDNNKALFVGAIGNHERITKSGIEAMLTRLGKKCGIENVHPHRYRRTLATNVLKKGMPIEEVKELLGHSKIDTTLIYAQISKDSVKFNYEKYMCA